MIPENAVWVFVGVGAAFPSGVFSTCSRAAEWISKNTLSGTLTAYPVDEGVFDWAIRLGLVTGTARTRTGESEFIGKFSSAQQEHFHYEHGGLA
jgi:hypothetical protein